MNNFVEVFNQACNAICHIEDRYLKETQGGFAGDGIQGTAFLIRKEKDGSALFATAKHVLSDYSDDRLQNIDLIFSHVLSDKGVPVCSRGIMEILKVYHHTTRDVSIIHATPTRAQRLVRYTDNDGVLQEVYKPVGADLSGHTPLLFGDDNEIQAGADVMIIGYGRGKEYVFADSILGPGSPKCLVPIAKHGIISQVIPADDKRLKELFLYDIQTAPGFSGSPVIICNKEEARVIGVHTNGWVDNEDIGYAHIIRFAKEIVETFEEM